MLAFLGALLPQDAFSTKNLPPWNCAADFVSVDQWSQEQRSYCCKVANVSCFLTVVPPDVRPMAKVFTRSENFPEAELRAMKAEGKVHKTSFRALQFAFLGAVSSRAKQTSATVKDVVDDADADHDGSINAMEFTQLASALKVGA